MAGSTPARNLATAAPRGDGAVALASSCALALLVVCVPAPACADNIGPHWGAAQIVAEHPGTTEVLVASYELKYVGDNPSTEHIILGLADDYGYVDNGAQRMIVDAKLQRIILVDFAAGSFRHASIYVMAEFAEHNRLKIIRDLRKTDPAVGMQSSSATFWNESNAGIILDDRPRPEIDVSETDGTLVYEHEGELAVRVRFSGQALSDGQRQRLRNLLRLRYSIHPDILEQIVKVGLLPEMLGVRVLQSTDVRAKVLTLASARIETAPFPLAANTERRFTGDHPFYADVLPIMEAAVAGKWQSGPKSREAYFSEIRAAVNRKAWFEAWLLHLELSLFIADSAGGCSDERAAAGSCVPTTAYWANLKRDPRANLYFEAAEIQNGEPVRAVEMWRSIPLEDVPNPYLMGVFIGNVVSVHGGAFEREPVDPYAMFTAAIRANPYLSSFYKDLGDHFRRYGQPTLAWICYDLGRALPNRPTGDVLEHVDQIESQLRQRVPQLF